MPLVHLGEGQEAMKIHKDMMRFINMKSFFGALAEMGDSAPVPDIPVSRSMRRYRTLRKARNRMAARSRKINRGR